MIKLTILAVGLSALTLFASNPALASCCLAALGCCDGGPCCQ